MEREDFLDLPPGFRFYPSDEELIVHYLQKKVNFCSVFPSVIGEIELYKFNPWELPSKNHCYYCCVCYLDIVSPRFLFKHIFEERLMTLTYI